MLHDVSGVPKGKLGDGTQDLSVLLLVLLVSLRLFQSEELEKRHFHLGVRVGGWLQCFLTGCFICFCKKK